MIDTDHDEFAAFFAEAEPRLRRALIATYGSERGREAAAEAFAYAWEHWADVKQKSNRVGFLYRVGQSRTRPRRTLRRHAAPAGPADPWTEPGLGRALGELSDRQRLAVVLVVGFDWTLRDVAELTGISISTVQKHLERGMNRLRVALEVRTP